MLELYSFLSRNDGVLRMYLGGSLAISAFLTSNAGSLVRKDGLNYKFGKLSTTLDCVLKEDNTVSFEIDAKNNNSLIKLCLSLTNMCWINGNILLANNMVKLPVQSKIETNSKILSITSSYGVNVCVGVFDEGKQMENCWIIENGEDDNICSVYTYITDDEWDGKLKNLEIQFKYSQVVVNVPKKFSLAKEEKLTLIKDGYILIPNVVPKSLCDNLVRSINHHTGLQFLEETKSRSNPSEKGQKKGGHIGNYFPTLKRAPVVMDIFENTGIQDILESLIGENNIMPVSGAQIALRHPTTEETPVSLLAKNQSAPLYDSFTKEEYHIDGKSAYGKKNNQQNFTLLVGVFLKDVSSEYHGNLIVYPGTHITHSQKFAEVGPESFFQGEGMPSWFKRNPDLPPPRQIVGKAGDVIISHYLLGHTVAPNTSSDVRYKIYFRVHSKSVKQNKLTSMTKPWIDWYGMKEVL